MLSKNINKWNCDFSCVFSKILIFFLIIFLSGCAMPEFAKPKKSNTRDVPVNAKDRARKNVTEGRGVSLKGVVGGSRRGTNYEFSSSNPLWRASLETIDFMPLSTVDYSGGVIITDWYGDSNNADESIKITVRFLSNKIQSNSIKIIIHNKKCKVNENCTISEIDSNIKFELQRAILAKAAEFDRQPKK